MWKLFRVRRKEIKDVMFKIINIEGMSESRGVFMGDRGGVLERKEEDFEVVIL